MLTTVNDLQNSVLLIMHNAYVASTSKYYSFLIFLLTARRYGYIHQVSLFHGWSGSFFGILTSVLITEPILRTDAA